MAQLTSEYCGQRLRTIAVGLTGVGVVSSAFQFWPFEGSRLWQFFCPSNTAVLAWVIVLGLHFLMTRGKGSTPSTFPHTSILAYLAVNMLSVTFSPDVTRSLSFILKLTVMLIGAYTLFANAISSKKHLIAVYNLAAIALAITVCYCLLARWFGAETFGFHGSAYKYGTYIGILTPLCGVFLFLSNYVWSKLLAAVLILSSLVSAGSLGALCAIIAGLAVAIILMTPWSKRFGVLGIAILATAVLTALWPTTFMASLRSDVSLTEKDHVNLKQRYIEWQAQLNLLGTRTITGTGAGCVNEYRSKFYYRLPKLNTLKAFDQNGWLATAAETGLFGLVCFCWIILHHVKLCYLDVKQLKVSRDTMDKRFVIANLAGLIGACVANMFSSVHYNGILIVFVLILVIIARTYAILREEQNAKE